MVRMIHLTTRLGHGIAAGIPLISLLHDRPCTTVPPPRKPPRTPPTNGTGWTPQRQWENVSSPKKPIIPPCTRPQQYHQSKKQYPILARPNLKRSSIHWLLLCHRFLTAHATLYPQPTNPPSYHQTNKPVLDLPWIHDISLEIDNALTAFLAADQHLNNRITKLHHANNDCSTCSIEQLHSTTSALWTEITTTTGPPAQPVPNLIPKQTMLMASPLHL